MLGAVCYQLTGDCRSDLYTCVFLNQNEMNTADLSEVHCTGQSVWHGVDCENYVLLIRHGWYKCAQESLSIVQQQRIIPKGDGSTYT
jgi:hypothetical protein